MYLYYVLNQITTSFSLLLWLLGKDPVRGGVAGAVLPRDPRSRDLLNWGSGVEGSLGHTGRPGGQHSCCQTGSNLPGSRRSPKAHPAALRTRFALELLRAPPALSLPVHLPGIQSSAQGSPAPGAGRRSKRIQKPGLQQRRAPVSVGHFPGGGLLPLSRPNSISSSHIRANL